MPAEPANTSARIAGYSLFAFGVATLAFGILDASLTYPEGAAARLAEIQDQGPRVLAIAALFALQQIFLLPLAVWALGRPRARGHTLTVMGAVALTASIVGHLVFVGATLAYYEMAHAQADEAQMAALFDRMESNPFQLAFMAMGLLGLVAAFGFLPGGLWRGGVIPWWTAAAFWVALVAEFALSGLSGPLRVLSAALVASAFVLLAVHLPWRRSKGEFPPRGPVVVGPVEDSKPQP